MSRRSFFPIVYSIFWGAVFVMLAVSLHLGLNSTYTWYTEKTSYDMYLAMTLLAVILLEATLVFAFLQKRRFLRLESRLDEEDGRESSRVWRGSVPLISMGALFLVCSAFALVTLHEYLLPDYKVNTVFILFTGSLSKIAVGLFAIVAFRAGLRGTKPVLRV
ncbi:MAG: hypothetical protein LN417_05210 [Candidatus Thermoplasmatota archaeon]|nr:hypothetical protein [Candidatus Thermoplasmatota archaeon]